MWMCNSVDGDKFAAPFQIKLAPFCRVWKTRKPRKKNSLIKERTNSKLNPHENRSLGIKRLGYRGERRPPIHCGTHTSVHTFLVLMMAFLALRGIDHSAIITFILVGAGLI